MFRVRSKRSVFQAAVAIPMAALLLTGCGDEAEAEPEAAPATSQAGGTSPSAADETQPSPSSSATLKSNEELASEMQEQLKLAAEQGGSAQLGAVTCEAVRGFMMTADDVADKDAVRQAAGDLLTPILEGASSADESVKAADLDSTTKKECSDQRQELLKATDAKSLESLTN